MWEIIDNEGVIYSGSESEMYEYWNKIANQDNPDEIEWIGDLRLIQVHDIYR